MTLCKALVEIIEIVTLTCDGDLAIKIKTAESAEDDDSALFHIKVLSENPQLTEVNFETLDCPELIAVVQGMQTAEEESHLCVQYADPRENGSVLQQSYCVCSSSMRLKLSHTKKKLSTAKGLSVHIRVFLPPAIVMQETRTVYRYLHLLKIYHPQLLIDFHLKIYDNYCISELSCERSELVGLNMEICADTAYYLRDTVYQSSTECVSSSSSEEVKLTLSQPYEFSIGLTTVAIRCPVRGPLYSGQTPVYGGLIVMLCIYGPMSLPICSSALSDDISVDLLESLPWESYGLQSFSLPAAECSLGDHFMCYSQILLQPMLNNKGNKQNSSVMFIHLHINTEECLNIKLGLLKWLLKNSLGFLMSYRKETKDTILDAMSKILEPNRKLHKKRDAYAKAIPEITKSICSIISRSENEHFRRHCYSMLKVTDSVEAETELEARLKRIAGGFFGDASVNPKCNMASTTVSDDLLKCNTLGDFDDLVADDHFEETFVDEMAHSSMYNRQAVLNQDDSNQ